MREWILLGAALIASSPARAQAGAPNPSVVDALDGKDPVHAEMLQTIAAYEAHDVPKVILEADRTLALDDKYKKLKPTERGFVYSFKGTAYLFSDRPKAALPLLAKAASLAGDSRTLYNLACAQAVLGMLPQAEVSFREALESASKDARFGDAGYWIEQSKSDDQLIYLRARPAYSRILKKFGKR